MAVSVNKPAAKAPTATNEVKEQAKAEVATEGVAIDPKIIGTLSDSLAYEGVVIEPTVADGAQFRVVGYRFLVLKDLPKIVPAFGLDTNASNVENSVAVTGRFVSAKAGEVLYLTRPETGALLLHPEFNKNVTGQHPNGDTQFGVSLVMHRARSVSATSGAAPLPTFSLTPVSLTEGPTKGLSTYVNPVEAYKATKNTSANGGTSYTRQPILEGPLAKFAPLVKKSTRSVSATKPTKTSYDPANLALLQAFGVKL